MSRLDILTTVGNSELLQRSGETIIGISTAALASLIEGAGIPFPAVAGTDGQVLAITAVDPAIEVGWVDASTAVTAAIAAHDAETAAHGIPDTSLLLTTSSIGATVQAYQATTSHMVQYAAGWPARPAVPAGTVIWVNKTNATAPTADEAGDIIFLTGA